jgi:hypothetical protein
VNRYAAILVVALLGSVAIAGAALARAVAHIAVLG